MRIKYPNNETKQLYKSYYRNRAINTVLANVWTSFKIIVVVFGLYAMVYLALVASGSAY